MRRRDRVRPSDPGSIVLESYPESQLRGRIDDTGAVHFTL
jgi:hypothetical protein